MLTAAIIREVTSVDRPEMSANFYETTRRNIAEYSQLYTLRHENLKPKSLLLNFSTTVLPRKLRTAHSKIL
jgi:hypothetical protein